MFSSQDYNETAWETDTFVTTYYDAVWCEDYFEQQMSEEISGEIANPFFNELFSVKKRWICPNVTGALSASSDTYYGLEVIVVDCEHAEPGYDAYAEGVQCEPGGLNHNQIFNLVTISSQFDPDQFR